jgi:hypothetical protein
MPNAINSVKKPAIITPMARFVIIVNPGKTEPIEKMFRFKVFPDTFPDKMIESLIELFQKTRSGHASSRPYQYTSNRSCIAHQSAHWMFTFPFPRRLNGFNSAAI